MAFRKPIVVITAGLVVPVLMMGRQTTRQDLANGMVAGVLMAAPFIYAQSCFYTERQRGTLQLLLALPITRAELVLAKFASLFSMTLFTINAPCVLLGDFRLLLYANATALFLAAVFMAATVISDKPWASRLPFWVVVILTLPFHRSVKWQWLASHADFLAFAALASVPAIVFISCRMFSRDPRN